MYNKKVCGVTVLDFLYLWRYIIVVLDLFRWLLQIIFAITLLFVFLFRPSLDRSAREVVTNTSVGFILIADMSSKVISFIFTGVGKYFIALSENHRMKSALYDLELERNSLLSKINELSYISDILSLFNIKDEIEYIPAKIIISSNNSVLSFLVDIRNYNNIKDGMIAVSNNGVVGRVINVTSDTARILSLDSIESSIPVFVSFASGGGVVGMLSGIGNGRGVIEYIDGEQDAYSKISEGDLIFTVKDSKFSVPNMIIGHIVSINNPTTIADILGSVIDGSYIVLIKPSLDQK